MTPDTPAAKDLALLDDQTERLLGTVRALPT